MNKKTIKEILEDAVENLFKDQPDIFEFTSDTGQTEWNLAHHLSIEIHKSFPWFDCDLEVTKGGFENRRPDIIFHQRGTHDHNFLVIETKRNGTPRDRSDDLEKIERYWFADPLCYRFGAAVNLNETQTYEVAVLENNGD